ncbi:MAG TPA: FAD-dependent oxidoreductase [Bacteroidetes bacterium]|nr:FAD-dependent oxidoreductase [Bacteroidota bacterium]
MSKKVFILGSGLSGLAAAVYLIKNKFPVTVLEKRPFSGGRTFSFQKEFWPFPIDNGPHVMLGCYTELLDLLKVVHAKSLLAVQNRLTVPFYRNPDSSVNLQAANLPAPFHLLHGLLRFSLLNWQQKTKIILAIFPLVRARENRRMDQFSAGDWFRRTGQDEAAVRVFWQPLILATLNAAPAQVSFLQLFRVLKIGFLAGGKNSRMIFIPEGLTRTLIEPLKIWIEKNGGKIKLQETVRKIIVRENSVREIITGKSKYDGFDTVVCALPFHSLSVLLDASQWRQNSLFKSVQTFHANVIMNFHFWYRGRLTDEKFLAIPGRVSQWLFMQKENDGFIHHTIVVSGANDLLSKSKKEMVEIVFAELTGLFPGFRAGSVQKYYITVEKNATLAVYPGIEKKRPGAKTSIANLFLAGDWTATGLPATMESAVKSGRLAAESVLEILT